jgi:hypothetical protein
MIARYFGQLRSRSRPFRHENLKRMKFPGYPKILLGIFLVTLPWVNPWVRGDGVLYYAYVRSLLVEQHLNFENDWRHADPSFRFFSIDAAGRIDPKLYTSTGHLRNDYAVGASILWAPFLIPVHAVMGALQRLGCKVEVDGFSPPYHVAMALATALYAFVGLFLSFRFAQSYVPEHWSFLATIGMWFASSLPVYMYFNPSYSHAHSVFAAALFLWYWNRTRHRRSFLQWVILGLLSGLLLDVYYLNIAILLVPLLESMQMYWRNWKAPGHKWEGTRTLFAANIAYCGATVAAFLPTLVVRWIMTGHAMELGYYSLGVSHWIHPALWQPLISSNHGLLTWTPIVIPAIAGLALLGKYDRDLAVYALAAALAMYYIVACHADWHGASSFGNRFFISLTPFFILGLAVSLQEVGGWFRQRRAADAAMATAIGALILWNLAFIFQWGMGLVPHRGPISWRQMAYNQVIVVPARLGSALKSYFTDRSGMMTRIGLEDVQRLRNE